jgi:hypothetical protein
MTIEHTMLIGPPVFPVFNEGLRELVDEPVANVDIVPFIRSDNADMNFAASAAWSSGCEWYFVILPEGIAFWNVYSRNGLLCTKHSFRFVEACFPLMAETLTKKRRTR